VEAEPEVNRLPNKLLFRLTGPVTGLLVCLVSAGVAWGQPKLNELEGYSRYNRFSTQRGGLVVGGAVREVRWDDAGEHVYFRHLDERYRVRLSDGQLDTITADLWPTAVADRVSPRRGSRVARAAQRTEIESPDGRWTAAYRDYNVWLDPKEGEAAVAVTTDGESLVRYGTACWVYGEELNQSEAMWWSPDSRKLAFYKIDERHQREYPLTVDNTELYTRVATERYPKAGDDNPYLELWIYDLESRQMLQVDSGAADQWYIYRIEFTPDGTGLLYHRTNRHQNHLQVMVADTGTGQSRLLVEEHQPAWQENAPLLRWLEDGERFIWETERTGFKQFELRHIDGSLLNPLTPQADYPVLRLVKLDEAAGWLYYTAASDTLPINEQLHRVRLDGEQAIRITPGGLNFSGFDIQPDHRFVVCVAESTAQPPQSWLLATDGQRQQLLAEADTAELEAKGARPVELFSFMAADGETTLFGLLHKPSDFDPERAYPLVISVYGGPSSRAVYNRFAPSDPHCEFGVLIAQIDGRGTSGRGKAFETAGYLQLGSVDIADQVAGVQHLVERSYVDGSRVGIFGHSYGGYMSALGLLRYPEVFRVAVAGAPVTDWRNYDTIYTERYMRTPQENSAGYAAGSCMTYVDRLAGRLLLVHGLIDDNVHPSNTWQLADALQRADKRFDMMIFPRNEHGIGQPYSQMRWEYLITHLRPEP
jgi:dipeptidyl-peptidase 4